MSELEIAKRFVRDYFRREFGETTVPDFSRLMRIGLAYTTTEDEEHDVQVNLNLLAPRPYIAYYVDGERVNAYAYEDLKSLNVELPFLEFDELISTALDSVDSLDNRIEEAKSRSEAGRDGEHNVWMGKP